MLDAISTLSLLALLLGLGLGYAAIRYQVKGNPLVEQINAILPQTQCGQCDFPGCRPYAEAIASGEVAINQCPPGGRSVHVFPEGTFTAASGLRPFQMGAFKVATDSGSPLLPVTLNGTRQVLRDGCLFPSYGPIKMTVSPLIQPRANDWKEAVRLRDTTYAQVLRYCGEGPLDLVKAGPYREG